MQAHRLVPVALGVFLAILNAPAALGGERAADYGEFLKQVAEEMRIVLQHEALLKRRLPKPGPSREQLLLDEERVRHHFRQAGKSQGEPPRKAPEPRVDLDKAARELVSKERLRAATRHAERVGRLVESAQEHHKLGRLDAAAKALRSALKIDPGNKRAASLLKEIEASKAAAEQVRSRRAIGRETAASFRYMDRIRVPQAALLTVPKERAGRKARGEDLFGHEVVSPAAAKDAAVRKALAAKMSIETLGAPLEDVVAYIRQVGKINVVLDTDAADQTVDLRLEDTSVEAVLGWVTKLTGLSYAVSGGVVHIGPKEKLAQASVIKIYDVSDILRVRQLLRKGRIRPDDLFAEPVGTIGELADELMGFIKQVTGRAHWGDDPDKAQMNFQLGRLVVNAEPAIQAKVLEVISKVRD